MKVLDYDGTDHLIDKIYDAINSGGSADYIVEEGYTSNWYYRKWASGIAECWQLVSLGSIAISSSYASGWYYYASGAWYYPTNLFTESPMVTGSVRRATGLFFISFNLNEKDRMRFYLASSKQESAQATEVNFYARGLWKEFTQSVMKSATLDTYYPVGSIYISVSSTFNPNTSFGGTWVKLTNRFLVGAGGTYSLGATGGEATHTLTVNEMPTHSHTNIYATDSGGNASWGYNYQNGSGKGSVSSATPDSGGIGYAGGSAAHNNLPPYQAVNMWQRTA